ncbi:MAG: response regulator [Lachnospiraceae bacterium]
MREKKLLIVDDELLVRTNIRLLLKSASNIVTICGEASNGQEALDKMEQLQPDIVLSDIKMPVMDGLTLCKMLRHHYPAVTFIALSNYDDFPYVHGILKNGGIDYLLKHEINTDTLLAIIKNSPAAPLSENPAINEDSLNMLRQNFINNLLRGLFPSEEIIEKTIQVLDIPLVSQYALPIILTVDNYSQTIRSMSIRQRSIIEFSILNIGNEIIRKSEKGILTHIENENYCILLTFPEIISKRQTNDAVQNLLHVLSSNLKTYLNLSTSYSIGFICRRFQKIDRSYDNAYRALQHKFYSGNASILHSGELENLQGSIASLDMELEKTLLFHASNGNIEEILPILHTIFNMIFEQKMSVSHAQMLLSDLASIITRTAKNNSLDLSAVFSGILKPNEIFVQLTTLQQFQEWFQKAFQSLCNCIKPAAAINSEYIKKAVNLMNRDFSLPISQQSIADEIGISTGYLCTVFKQETGQGFNDYLTSLRIKNAICLLECKETDFHKIALTCGFPDYSYFFKVFKRKTGLTPTEYLSENFI